MGSINKKDWQEAVRKTRYLKGKKLTKKELNDIMTGLIILKPKETKENWKVKQEPLSIKSILNLKESK